ncbi:MAG: hypothetical protein GF401_01375 [Chitinivibrionales bacterium]|nr:hypothetical protein [Chitinivibrionales bacterium]
MEKTKLKTIFPVIIFVCLMLAIGLLVVQFGVTRQQKKTLADQQAKMSRLSKELEAYKGKISHSSDALHRRKEEYDSLQQEMARIHDFIDNVRGKMKTRNTILDSVEDKVEYYKAEEKRRLADLDSLGDNIERVKAQLKERFAEQNVLESEVERLKALLHRARKKIAVLQTDHTIRVLFVYDNYLDSDDGKNDENIHFGEKKGMVISLFDSCAALNGWRERYCDLPKLIYGINTGARYIEIKNVSQKHDLNFESLFFLAKTEGYDPLRIHEWQLKELVSRAFHRFNHDRDLCFRKASWLIDTKKFLSYRGSREERFRNGKSRL